MHPLLIPALWLAGVIHLLIALANFFLPAMLDYQGNLRRVTPVIRQIFRAHAAYIVLTVAGFGLLCLFFAPDLVGRSSLGRCLSGFLALFWGSRLVVQFLYYDPSLRRERPWGNLVFSVAFLYLGLAFAAACLLGP